MNGSILDSSRVESLKYSGHSFSGLSKAHAAPYLVTRELCEQHYDSIAVLKAAYDLQIHTALLDDNLSKLEILDHRIVFVIPTSCEQ